MTSSSSDNRPWPKRWSQLKTATQSLTGPSPVSSTNIASELISHPLVHLVSISSCRSSLSSPFSSPPTRLVFEVPYALEYPVTQSYRNLESVMELARSLYLFECSTNIEYPFIMFSSTNTRHDPAGHSLFVVLSPRKASGCECCITTLQPELGMRQKQSLTMWIRVFRLGKVSNLILLGLRFSNINAKMAPSLHRCIRVQRS